MFKRMHRQLSDRLAVPESFRLSADTASISGARLCPQDQPQRSAVTGVSLIQCLPVGEALRLVFQTQPRSVRLRHYLSVDRIDRTLNPTP